MAGEGGLFRVHRDMSPSKAPTCDAITSPSLSSKYLTLLARVLMLMVVGHRRPLSPQQSLRSQPYGTTPERLWASPYPTLTHLGLF